MNIKQRLRQRADRVKNYQSPKKADIQLCMDALAEIERLEKHNGVGPIPLIAGVQSLRLHCETHGGALFVYMTNVSYGPPVRLDGDAKIVIRRDGIQIIAEILK